MSFKIFLSGTNQNNALLLRKSPSILARKPFSINQILKYSIKRKEKIIHLVCGSSFTIIVLSTGKLLIWGLPNLQSQNITDSSNFQDDTILFDNDKSSLKSNSRFLNQFIIQNKQFTRKSIQKISAKDFSIILLVENQVFSHVLPMIPQKESSKIKFNKISFDKVTKRKIVNVCAGNQMWIAIDENGDTFSWGENNFGQLGHSDQKERTNPEKIQKISEAKLASIGGNHIMVVTKTNKVYSCGKNKYGQLGLGDFENRNTPELPELPYDIGSIKQVECGNDISILLGEDGRVFLCGKAIHSHYKIKQDQNKFIQCIISQENDILISQVFAGGFDSDYCFFLDNRGKVYSLGSNLYGQLGIGVDDKEISIPQLVSIPEKYIVKSCACGWVHSCFLVSKYEANLIQDTNQNQSQKEKFIDLENIQDTNQNQSQKENFIDLENLGNFAILSDDEIIEILSYLPKHYLGLLASVSKNFLFYSSLDCLWKEIFLGDFLFISKPEQQFIDENLNQENGYKKAYIYHRKYYNILIQKPLLTEKENKLRELSKKTKIKKSEIRCLMLGLDQAGKTTILYELKIGEAISQLTIGK
ncbi:regulator of chromosome condensation [Anaeramoeba ignava]|uniref:Regulator of chromosome condensation n=1 Tax=Anaeramoeba ignava TaxID=1746090 RepID=A0A9Q0R695_ANAIG|nr:regulator of chromosome condensation [Anaeramoeba ignava]